MVDPRRNKPDLTSALRAGARVMIRRRLTPDEIAAAAGTLEANRTLTDVVGTVRAVDEGVVTVTTRRGAVRFPVSLAVIVKELGPRPSRRGAPHRAIGVDDLEEVAAAGWLPRESAPFGGWLLRAAGGYTARANSALALGSPPCPTHEALTAVTRWYRERGLPARIQVPLAPGFAATDDPLVREALALGWECSCPVVVMTAASVEVAGGDDPGGDDDERLDVTTHLDEAWWSLDDERARRHEQEARGVLTRSAQQRFLTLRDDGGEVAAHARLALTPGWAGIFALTTRADVRRRGLAARLVRACGEQARRAGAASMHVQVASGNTAAIALFEDAGFTTHHTGVFLQPAAG